MKLDLNTVLKNILSTKYILLFLCALWIYWLWTRRQFYMFAWKNHAINGLPLIGIYYKFKSRNVIFDEIQRMFDALKRNTLCTWLGLYPAILTIDPAIIETVLMSPNFLSKADSFYNPLNKAFRNGLITSAVPTWKKHRKILNYCFQHKALLSFMPILNNAKKAFTERFDLLVNQPEQKLLNEIQKLVLFQITFNTVMGESVKKGKQFEDDMIYHGNNFLDNMSKKIGLHKLHLSWLISLDFRYLKSFTFLENFIGKLIVKRMDIIHDENYNAANTLVEASYIIADRIIKTYDDNIFTMNDVFGESLTMIGASVETTASVILHTIIALATHAEVQERLFIEICNVFPNKNFDFHHEHIQQLPYLQMVINEVLRLMPPIPFIQRMTDKDIKLEDMMLLPKGMEIAIFIFHLHRRTDIWGENAHKFNPDNFLPENIANKHRFAFIPFSKGSRNCIGGRYALIVLNVIISQLVRHYIFKTNVRFEDIKFKANFVLTLVNEPSIQIISR